MGFLIKNDIQGTIEECYTPPNKFLESKWIVLKGKSNIAIGVVYGTQETAHKDEIEQQFQELTTKTNMMQKNNKVIILGDLNAKVEINKHQCTQKESRMSNTMKYHS